MKHPSRRRCSATTRRGEQCRRWATRDSDPPLCVAHAGRGAGDARHPADEPGATVPGRCLHVPERKEPAHAPKLDTLSLDEEISLARICLLRVAEALEANGGLTVEQRVRLVSLIFRGVSTIARLLRDRQAVSDEDQEGWSAIVDRAMEAAAAELGVKL
ncbi:MAG: hypothetical protein RBU35_12255 [Anaerolineae bacterium]|jgi:hypothetical protein|nr:hypothetical protein [Anaerolineae bacterium]